MTHSKYTRKVIGAIVEFHGEELSLSAASKLAAIQARLSQPLALDGILANAIRDSKIARKAKKLDNDAPEWQALARPTTTNSKMQATAKMCGIAQTHVVAFDLLAGKTCPWADVCRAHVSVKDGSRRVIDGKKAQFRCYAAKLEAAFGESYRLHKKNTDIVMRYSKSNDVEGLAQEILTGLLAQSPNLWKFGGVVRIHASGDFVTETYRLAWQRVAQVLSNVIFFGYSKGAEAVKMLNESDNIFFVHSDGSTQDDMAVGMGLAQSFVRLPNDTSLDHVPTACPTPNGPDDIYHVINNTSFALNFH